MSRQETYFPSHPTSLSYDFGSVPYQQMYAELAARDDALYARNGVLQMLSRNSKVKVRGPFPPLW